MNETLWASRFARATGIQLPIIQAPMAGASTPDLAAAASNAGALGSLAAGYAPPNDIRNAIAAIRQRTSAPFSVNVFAPQPADPPRDPQPVLALLGKLHEEIGLAPPALPQRPPIAVEEQVAVLAEERVPVVSFTFGILPDAAVAALKASGAYLVGTATTVDEALLLERHGIDAVVAQGAEAGGHRGTFRDTPPAAGLVGTMALVPQIVSAVRIPVIAAGGIMDGRGIAAARVLGADAVQLGTAFLGCRESGVPPSVKESLARANESDTIVTNAMTGKHARAVRNRFSELFEGTAPLGFVWQGALLMQLRNAAVAQGRTDLLPLFAGQGLRLLRRDIGAAELLRELARETAEAAKALQ